MIFLVSLWSLSYYASHSLREDLELVLSDQQFATATMVAADLEGEFENRFKALENVAGFSSEGQMNESTALQALLDNRSVLQSLFNGDVIACSLDGKMLANFNSSLQQLCRDYINTPKTAAVLKQGKPAVSQLFLNTDENLAFFWIAVPVYDMDGKVIGALAGMINLANPNFLDSITHSRYGMTGGYLIIARDSRTIISATDKTRVLETLPPVGVNPSIDRFIQGYEGSVVMLNPRGIEVLASNKTIPLAGWNVIATLPTEEAFAPIRRMLNNMRLVTIGMTLVAGLMVWLVLRRQLAPLISTTKILNHVANMTQQRPSLPITRHDEIGQLIAAFNRLLENLEYQETALRKSELFGRIILDSVPSEIAVLDSAGNILMANQPWLDFSQKFDPLPGKPFLPSEVGENYLDLSASSPGAVVSEDTRRIVEGIHTVLNGSAQSFSLEYRCELLNQTRWFSLIVTPLLLDGRGAVVSYTDITERKLIADQEKFHADLMRSISDAVITTTPDQIITSWNKAAEISYGWSAREAIGKHLNDLLKPETSPDLDRLAKEYLMVNKVWKGEVCQHRKDGWAIWVLSTNSILEDANGNVIGGVTINHDISRRKQNEIALLEAKADAEKANHAKSRFLAAASHDLRQPLAALSLYVDLLNPKVAESQREIMTHISCCVESLTELLTDLLDISKLDAGVITPLPSDFAIDDLLTGLVTVFTAESQRKELHLRLRSSGVLVRADRMLLHRIVGNLIINAIRYTEKGGVLIACRRHAGKRWIEVWDTGIGIPKDKNEIIFEEFRQLGDDAHTRGSGLGLAIVTRMAALMGMRVRFRSRLGRGSMFAIELPDSLDALPATSPVAHPAPDSIRIGVVDDNPQILQATSLALEQAGHQVVLAGSGKQLLERLGPDAPELIISDYRLANGENGFDVVLAVRNTFGASLPAILITGDTDPELIRSMRSQGIAIHYKPLRLDNLLEHIRTAIQPQ